MSQKIIHTKDINHVTLDELKIGDIVSEGVVIKKILWNHGYMTPSGSFLVEYEDKRIAVYAHIDDEALDILLEFIRETSGDI